MESHDHVFWCGDMNYRIELEKTKAQYYIQKSDWMVCRDRIINCTIYTCTCIMQCALHTDFYLII